MYASTALFVFLFGTIIGSFLNVVILRFNTGMTFGGRSMCFACGKQLNWHELIPVWSFLFLRGKCRGCQSRISFQYPLVEFATGALFTAVFAAFGQNLIELVYYMVIMALLVVIFVYDIRHKIIPDAMVYSFALLSLAHLYWLHGNSLFHLPDLWNLLAGPILFVPFALLWLVSRGTWMGFGDAKLALAIGFGLGLTEGASAIILGFWIGAAFSIAYLLAIKLIRVLPVKNSRLSLMSKRLTIKSEIPFAPYLIFGYLAVLFLHIDVLSLGFLIGSN